MKSPLLLRVQIFLVAMLLVFSMLLPPEGMFRDGSYQLVVLGWFFAAILSLTTAFFGTVTSNVSTGRESARNGSKDKKKPNSITDNTADNKTVRPGKLVRCLDILVACFFFWIALSYSALYHGGTGNLRMAANSFWLWESFGLVYLVFRLWPRPERFGLVRDFLILIIAITIAQACYSLYCYSVRDPMTRREYLANPDEMLRRNGLYYPEGSPERILLENRILGSTEPLGTYALTNTLAGVLLPILILFTAFGWSWIRNTFFTRRDARHLSGIGTRWGPVPVTLVFALAWAVTLMLLFACLILTKSRTGILSLAFGLALIPMTMVFGRLFRTTSDNSTTGNNARILNDRRRYRRQFLIAIAGILFVLVVGIGLAFRMGILDREVFTEAGKSLGYRLQYWQSSCRIMEDMPWFGTGPGNFQNRYPQYMLPEASEVIADPHNFFFELATNFGIPAVVLFLGIVLGLVILVFRGLITRDMVKESTCESPCSADSRDSRNASVRTGTRAVCFGGLLGPIALWLVSRTFDVPVDGVMVVIAIFCTLVVFAIDRWFMQPWRAAFGTWDWLVYIPAISDAVLLNLCAAGGIGYPAIATLIWLGLASLVTWGEQKWGQKGEQSGVARVAVSSNIPSSSVTRVRLVLSVPLVLLVVAFVFAERLFITNNLAQAVLNEVAIAEGQVYFDASATLAQLGTACRETDRYSIPLAKKYYELASGRFMAAVNERNEQVWRDAREHLLDVAPCSAAICAMIGERELTASVSHSVFLSGAKDVLAQAVVYAPVDAKNHALYSLALQRSGDEDLAKKEALEALRLDEQTPHRDRKLSDELRAQVKEIL